MNHDKICTWLGLPSGQWPPDHYALLGLTPGEGDVTRIETHVQERLAKLRCYQLSHPDQATEAMNRLAQAFMCLTDPEAKRAYDQAVGNLPQQRNGGAGDASKQAPSKPRGIDDTAVPPKTQVDWQGAPPPERTTATIPPPANSSVAANDQPPPPSLQPAQAAPPPPLSQPADALYEAALTSPEARRGLGTIHKLVERIDHTRRLLWAWELAGKILDKPKRRLTQTASRTEWTRRLGEISELLVDFPRILGQPGQPGYRVMALARLEMTPDMFNMLDPAQREALAADWRAGRVILLGHRRFLRRELKTLRRRSWISRCIRATRAALNDHPRWVLIGVALAALAIALFYLL
jgi:hypothetical protein